ncbi:MAG: fused MFS/spermidine synthase, partial [Gammaproteobacteria bacterium]
RQNRHRQIVIHAVVIAVSLSALPLALPQDSLPPTDGDPTVWLIGTLLLAIGLPFFVVSTTAPLLQKWFANVGHHTSHDPYYLYAASNAGSLIALLSYPFVLEPNIGLAAQQSDWSIGYALLCLMIVGCAAILWRGKSKQTAESLDEVPAPELSPALKLHWLVLAFVPSSLLLGLTNFISTDIASVPLLWIIPLTVYLLSFVIVFAQWGHRVHPYMVWLQPVVLLPFLAFSFINPAIMPYWLNLALHLSAFFVAVMVCHGELAKRRPHTRHLTDYYLIMSFGGMLGGMFNTFVAPFAFNAVYEYPIMIVAALLLRPGLDVAMNGAGAYLKWGRQLVFPALVIAAGMAVYAAADDLPRYLDAMGTGLILLTGVIYAFRAQPLPFALLSACVIFFTLGLHSLLSNTLFQERTFFGVLSVREAVLTDENGRPEKYRELYHGTTKHGAQRLAPGMERIPLTYYSRPGPMGQLFKEYDADNGDWHVGVVGLGAGALACYAKPGQHWTLYEIDPLVRDIAENPEYFTYLKNCGRNMAIRIGDARLSLGTEPEHQFDLLVMDAFSSDSVPTHLLTQEALKLYFDKLKPNGILAFHITNRHLALKNVLADHAKRLHLAGLIQEFKPREPDPLVIDTDWAVMAKDPKTLEPLLKSRLGNWQKMPLVFNLKPWTDDFTNIVGIWKTTL